MPKSLKRRLATSFTQHKLLTALQEKGRFSSQREWAEAAGVHEVTVMRALQNETFLALYRNVLLRRAHARIPAVLDAAVEVASRPEHTSHADRRMLLEMTGLYTPKSKAEVSGQVSLDFVSLIRLARQDEPALEVQARELRAGDEGDE